MLQEDLVGFWPEKVLQLSICDLSKKISLGLWIITYEIRRVHSLPVDGKDNIFRISLSILLYIKKLIFVFMVPGFRRIFESRMYWVVALRISPPFQTSKLTKLWAWKWTVWINRIERSYFAVPGLLFFKFLWANMSVFMFNLVKWGGFNRFSL